MSNSTLFTSVISGLIVFGVFGTASALTVDQGEPNSYYANQLQANRYPVPDQLRNTLVEPYLEQIHVKGSNNSDNQKMLKVWIMADDLNGAKIYFNQVSKKFGLAHYQPGEHTFTYTKYQELNSLGEVFMSRN